MTVNTELEEGRVALVDMDGVLCDYRGALDRDMAKVLGPMTLASDVMERIEVLVKSQAGWYRNLKPLPLGIKIYETLRDIGFQVVINSKGSRVSKNSWTEKVEWINEHLGDNVLVNLTQAKQIVYGRVMVDDYPAHFKPWLEKRPRGIVVVPAQSWNEEIETGGQIIKVHTLEDIEDARPILEEAFSR